MGSLLNSSYLVLCLGITFWLEQMSTELKLTEQDNMRYVERPTDAVFILVNVLSNLEMVRRGFASMILYGAVPRLQPQFCSGFISLSDKLKS